MDNGIVQLTLSKPEGSVTGIKYKGVENALSHRFKEHSRGYIPDLYFCFSMIELFYFSYKFLIFDPFNGLGIGIAFGKITDNGCKFFF